MPVSTVRLTVRAGYLPMPRRPLGDRAMTAAERQARHRLRLAGGPAVRFEREVRRALLDGLAPADVRGVVDAVLGGIPVPAEVTSVAGEAPKRDIQVTISPPPLEIAVLPVPAPIGDAGVTETIPAIAARWLAEFNATLDPDRQPRRARANAQTRTVYMRPVTNLDRLHTLAHELGHIVFEHIGRGPPRYVAEFQASVFAMALLTRDGQAVDPAKLASWRWYVGQQVHWRTRAGGGWVDPRIAAWAAAFDPTTPGLHRSYGHPQTVRLPQDARDAALLRNAAVPEAKRVDYFTATLVKLAALGLPVPEQS